MPEKRKVIVFNKLYVENGIEYDPPIEYITIRDWNWDDDYMVYLTYLHDVESKKLPKCPLINS